jgi:hypothetical protein
MGDLQQGYEAIALSVGLNDITKTAGKRYIKTNKKGTD